MQGDSSSGFDASKYHPRWRSYSTWAEFRTYHLPQLEQPSSSLDITEKQSRKKVNPETGTKITKVWELSHTNDSWKSENVNWYGHFG